MTGRKVPISGSSHYVDILLNLPVANNIYMELAWENIHLSN